MNPKRSFRFVLMEGTPGAGGGGGDPAAAAAAAGGDKGEQGGEPAAGTSALAKVAPLHERIPEKFHVKKGEEFDAEASMGKVLESYQQLESRMRDSGAPPKAPEEYTITVPDELKETFKEDEGSTFRKEAHEAGLTQKQFDFVMDRFFKMAPELAAATLNNTAEGTIAALDKAWGDKYDANLAGAQKAFEAYADPEDKGKFDDIMRSPALAYRILAKIAPELGEARGVPGDASGGGQEDVQALLTHPGAGDPKHPEHKTIRAKLDAHYAKKYGTAAVT